MSGTKRITILNFHGIGSPPSGVGEDELRYWLAPAFFAQILDYAKGKPDVHLTFDDGNASDCEIALPALQKRNLHAAFFVVSERIDCTGYLSAAQIKTLQAESMEVGAHGARHRKWTRCKPLELSEEVTRSRKRLEDIICAPVLSAACPFGAYNRRVLKCLRATGYQRVFTSDDGYTTTSSWLCPRNTIMSSATLQAIQRIVEENRRAPTRWWWRTKLLVKRWR